jgi:predicted RNA-binding Zn-ribbon protein involved in translation (DUF1610 family)
MLLLIAALYTATRPQLLETVGVQPLVGGVVALAAVVAVALAAARARAQRLRCPSCGHEFHLSTGGQLVGQDWSGDVRGTCPSCGTRGPLQDPSADDSAD